MAAYENANASFRSLCKTIFGKEVGDLKEFEPYLKEILLPHRLTCSQISGKEVFLGANFYPSDAGFISQDETSQLKFEPFNVNEIKDIDSLLCAGAERLVYCGNKKFGNNSNVELVDNCAESSNILYCFNNYHVKNAAYCCQTRESENIFGITTFPFIRDSMRCMEGMNLVRGFETYYTTNSSDMYYSFNCSGCSNCIFSFNLRSKSNMIGNLQLTKERYNELKFKLLEEIAEKLKKDKKIFSILDIAIAGCAEKAKTKENVPFDPIPDRVEKAFSATTATVLGKEHSGLGKYKNWLTKRTLGIEKIKGATGAPTYSVSLPIVKDIPAQRLVSAEEALGKTEPIELKEGEMPSLSEIFSRIAPKAYFTLEFKEGHSENVVDVTAVFNANNCYAFWDATDASLSAYSSAVIKSKCVFGGYLRILQSHSCINCYDCTDLNRCFEADGCYSSSNLYFSHNCENVHEGIFCFNAKNLKYAIWNTQVGREEYLRVKKILLDYVNMKLEKECKLDLNVFSIKSKR